MHVAILIIKLFFARNAGLEEQESFPIETKHLGAFVFVGITVMLSVSYVE